nr:hypothetical protein [Tanacetum cinerariifolium]
VLVLLLMERKLGLCHFDVQVRYCFYTMVNQDGRLRFLYRIVTTAGCMVRLKLLKINWIWLASNKLHWGGILFSHVVERLLSSDHLSSALVDLLQKAVLVGRSQVLREVASSGIGVELVYIKDFDPNAEQNYDRAIKSFYRVKFLYVDLLVHYAGHNVGKLMTLKPPIISFENASADGPSASHFL